MFQNNGCYVPIEFKKRNGSILLHKTKGVQVIVPKEAKLKIIEVIKKPQFKVEGSFDVFPEGLVDITLLCEDTKQMCEEYLMYERRKRHQLFSTQN